MKSHIKLTGLGAALLCTLSACGIAAPTQSVPAQTAPTPVVQSPPAAQASPEPIKPAVETSPGKPPAPTEPVSSGTAGGTSAQVTAPTPAEQTKTYRLNPKTVDIVPISPDGNKKVVLLTFDDGPKNKETLEPLLDTLDKHKAKAIFFVNGYLVKRNPELLKQIHERGQYIGNHSWDHIDLKKENNEKVTQQITDVQTIVKDLIGKPPVFFRPPFGSGSDYVRQKALDEHLLYMTWSNGSKDWEMSTKKNNPDEVVQNVLDQLRPGSNILMHELPWTGKALDTLLTRLEEKQYAFVDPGAIETP
ncbi:polysaccharide deacetylase family protein [Paenibacillus thalictri]|uniref:Polysaccharide deacetylase family protein n=1 Tax=Paenibacillus thalictri TaxID=2527873 RepID=A0A4Q9DVQ8_9BACL|nr:polysaccharide deacetylase family protein [Paenibacillus thalictri]TBL79778.1 polysaccharide deacetylase family protein [Paenibacillus thalictri]